MATDAQLHQWRKNRDRSRRSLVGDVLFGVAGTLFLIGCFIFVVPRLPAWVFPVGFAGVWFQFIGDWINIRTLDRRDRRGGAKSNSTVTTLSVLR